MIEAESRHRLSASVQLPARSNSSCRSAALRSSVSFTKSLMHALTAGAALLHITPYFRQVSPNTIQNSLDFSDCRKYHSDSDSILSSLIQASLPGLSCPTHQLPQQPAFNVASRPSGPYVRNCYWILRAGPRRGCRPASFLIIHRICLLSLKQQFNDNGARYYYNNGCRKIGEAIELSKGRRLLGSTNYRRKRRRQDESDYR